MPTNRPAGENLKGWPIDLRELYGSGGWSERARFTLREHVFETPRLDACLLLYYIGEIGISKEVGRLAVYARKESPRIILDRAKTLFWYFGDSTIQWSVDGSLAFLFECEVKRKWLGAYPERLDILLHTLDFSSGRYARLDRGLADHFRVRQVNARRFAFEPWQPSGEGSAPPVDLNLDELEWRDFSG